jgi:hypothetical protein
VDYVGLSSIHAGASFDVVRPKENDTNSHARWIGPCGLNSKQATSSLSRGIRCGQKKKVLLYCVRKGLCHNAFAMSVVVRVQLIPMGSAYRAQNCCVWVGVGAEGQAEMRARLRRFGGLARDRLPRFLLGRSPHAGFSASVHNDFEV